MQQPTIHVQLFASQRLRVAFTDHFAFVAQGYGMDPPIIFLDGVDTPVVANCRQVRTLFSSDPVYSGPMAHEDAVRMQYMWQEKL